MRTARTQIPRHRARIARALLLLPFAILGVRAAQLSVDERGRTRGENQTQRILALAPERGTIVDALGAELAISVDSPSIYAIPSEMLDVDAAARKLAPVFGWKVDRLSDTLRTHTSFLFLSRWVTAEQANRVRALDLRGVGVIKEPRRIYPHGQLAAQAMGFANIDGFGVRGIEQQEDDWLRGAARRIPVERDARGRLIWIGGAESWNTAGGDVALTIDATLQATTEAALREAVEASGARDGVVIVMDPQTGDILTLAEAPGFDPNNFRKLRFTSTRSRAFHDAMDPGSTLKAFLVAAALEDGALKRHDSFDCENGAYPVPGKTIRDHHPHGRLSVADILRVSSNIGAVKIAYALGPSAHYEALRRFGFGGTTNSLFPGESAGLLRSWKAWKPVDHATIAFGQGINVTPIQLAAATAALANGGLWVRPRLVAAHRAPGGVWQRTPVEVERRVFREETAAAVLEFLEGAVGPGGTGRRARLRGVRVAGKTGTPQRYDAAARSYSTDLFDSWFIGVVPADEPKLAIVVAISEPKRPAHTGGATAAPLFARVAAAQLTRFGIFTEPEQPSLKPSPNVLLAASSAQPDVSAAPITQKPRPKPHKATRKFERLEDRFLLPDFMGLTVAEVRQITAGIPLDVKISGLGRAVSQDPPAGTVVANRGAPVRILFEAPKVAHREGEI